MKKWISFSIKFQFLFVLFLIFSFFMKDYLNGLLGKDSLLTRFMESISEITLIIFYFYEKIISKKKNKKKNEKNKFVQEKKKKRIIISTILIICAYLFYIISYFEKSNIFPTIDNFIGVILIILIDFLFFKNQIYSHHILSLSIISIVLAFNLFFIFKEIKKKFLMFLLKFYLFIQTVFSCY